jgi:hypothetical protein
MPGFWYVLNKKLTMKFTRVLLMEHTTVVWQKPSIIHILQKSNENIDPIGQLLDWASQHILSVVNH